MLANDSERSHTDAYKSIDMIEKALFFPDYQGYFDKLVPRDSPLILAHNDAHELNILMLNKDNTKLLVIDYEYAGWQGMACDLANHLNEMMMENAELLPYVENCATDEEI